MSSSVGRRFSKVSVGTSPAQRSRSAELQDDAGGKQSLDGRAATAELQWQRHHRAAMAAAATNVSHHITTLTPEDKDRRATPKLFGGLAQVRTEIGREAEKEERKGGNECLVCGALFGSQDKLRLHTFCHAGEKPFRCSQPHCHKAFSSKYKLYRYDEYTSLLSQKW